ncbi:aspartate aminotransferase family protein [soil metagenome]
MPFSDNRSFKANPRMMASAKGCHYYDETGRSILDATAGLWCVNAGHARKPIVDAIRQQAETLDFSPTFQLAHPLIFELSNRLLDFFPDPINRFFFGNSGSEAVDSALKIAFAYHHATGETARTRLIGRMRGYHGVGFGGISVGGLENNRRAFPLLANVDHLSATFNLEEAAFSRGQPAWGVHLADELEAKIAQYGAHSIAAVIIEPLSGSAGVLVPPVGYLERIRAITKQHGILLIFDEVITAFGRLGAATAAERFGVIPDMIVTAKGITNGSVPMGCVGASQFIYDQILESANAGIEFFHGYTYTGHPLAAAAALATLQVYEDEALFTRSRDLEAYFEDAVHSLADFPHVIDVRNLGLVAGIELAPRDGAPGRRAMDLFRACFDSGLLVRVTGDIIALSPPLIFTREMIDETVDRIGQLLKKLN